MLSVTETISVGGNTLEKENLNIRRKQTLPLINPDKHLFVCEDQKLISLAFSFQGR